MMELFGLIPASLRERGKLSSKYFDEEGESLVRRAMLTTPAYFSGDLLHIKQLYPCSLGDLFKQTLNPSMLVKDRDDFQEFLRDMLQYEASERKKATELLKDAWLSNETSESQFIKPFTQVAHGSAHVTF
jgi:hypothetical protein